MDWISTNERMPDSGVMVILFSPQVTTFVGCFYQDRWMYSRYFRKVHESNEITHWMPLPLPPITP